MQRAATAYSTTTKAAIDHEASCPVCGESVRGIAATRPGEHRFVGCDHYASGRFLRHRGDEVAPHAPRLRLGP